MALELLVNSVSLGSCKRLRCTHHTALRRVIDDMITANLSMLAHIPYVMVART